MTDSLASLNLKKTLSQKQILIVFISSFFFMLNLSTMLNLLPLYVIYTGGTEFSAGVQNSIFSISAVILRFLLGPIADTKGRRILLIVGSFVFATSPLVLWLAPSYFIQAIGRVYQAIGIATFLSSASSLIADYTPLKFRGRVIGAYRSILSFSLVIGPTLGLRIIESLNYGAFFMFNAFICVICFFLVLQLPKDNIKSLDHPIKAKEVLLNVKLLIKNKKLVLAYCGIGVVSLSNGALFTYLTIYALKSGISYPGIYFTIFAGIGIFATSYSGYLSDKVGREKIIWPSIFCLGIGVYSLSLLQYLGSSVFYISAFLAGIGYSAGLATLVTWVIDNANEEVRATALTIQENSIDLGMAIGSFALGIGTIVFDLSTLFLLLSIVTIISAFGLYKIKT